MGKFKKSLITNAGKAILFGGGDVTYTKAVLYSQDLSSMSDDEIKSLTSIDGKLLDTRLVVNNRGDSNVVIEAVFSNKGLKDDVEFSAVGWFAKAGDGTEILTAISPIEGTKILGAGSPDRSSQSIDLKLNMAISDSAEIHVSIDPAGSVSVADLNKAVNGLKPAISDIKNLAKHAQATADSKADSDDVYDKKTVDGKLDVKADSADVTKALDGKANASDLASYTKSADLADQLKSYATNDSVAKGLALKADQSSVAELFKNYTTTEDLTKMLAVKVDKTVLDDAIAKLQASIDTKADRADFDSKIDAVNKAMATKANSADTYSKAELDKKLLAMSTDTNGKVSADQVTKMIADKANSSDVYTKKDVDDKLAVKVDKTALDAEIAKIQANVESELATKATKADVDAEIESLTADKANSSDVYTKSEVDSAVNGLKPSITDASNQAKHAQDSASSAQATANNALPKAGGNMNLRSTINWNGGGINDKTGNLGGLRWSGGTDSASIYGDQNNSDNLDLAIDLGDDGSNHVSFRQNGKETSAITSDGHFTGTVDWGHVNGRPADTVTVINSYDVANNKEGPHNQWPVGQAWYVDQTALHPFADAINDINGTWNRYTHNNGFDLLTLWGQYGIHYCLNSNMTNVPGWFNDKRGTAFVFKFDGNSQTIIYAGCISDGLAYYNKLEGKWHKLVTEVDTQNLQNQINTLKTQLNDAVNTINYLKQNMIIGRHFSNDQQAQSWYNANPNGIAFIDK